MQRAVAVAIAGAAGALARCGIGLGVGVRSFPWATLAINVAGSLALGYVLSDTGLRWDVTVRTALAVGFLGAFTTFSTFSYETATLVRTHRTGTAALYVVLSVALGLAGSAVGYAMGRAHA